MKILAQSSNDVSLFLLLAKKHYGKTTLGKYLLEYLNKPAVIIDVVKQFEANTPYRKVIRGVQEFKYYLSNKHYKKAFYKAKMQIIFRFTSTAKERNKEVEELFQFLNDHLNNITIFCEELETYVPHRLEMGMTLFDTFYACRNFGFDIIAIAKIAGKLAPLIKDQTDYFIVNTNELNAIKYLNERSGGKFKEQAKHLKKREFLITNLDDYNKKFKLKPNIIKLIK